MQDLTVNYKLILSPRQMSWPFMLISSVLHALPLGLFVYPMLTTVQTLTPAPISVVFIEPQAETKILQPSRSMSERPMKIRKNHVIRAQEDQNEVFKVKSTERAVGVIKPESGNQFPAYPELARINEIEGIVTLEITVDRFGKVEKLTPVLPKAHPLLEQAAIAAVKKWRFEVIGVTDKQVFKQEIKFSLNDLP